MPAFWAGMALMVTSPARIMAWAFCGDSARPRSTRSWSRRVRRGLEGIGRANRETLHVDFNTEYTEGTERAAQRPIFLSIVAIASSWTPAKKSGVEPPHSKIRRGVGLGIRRFRVG